MLTRFAITNYRGFSQRLEWDLAHPSNYTFNRFAIKDDVIKNGIIYGPNGSGKTNLGLSLFDIVNHLTQKFKKSDYYKNFIYAGNPDGLVKFEYTFKFGDQILQYNYAKTSDGKLIDESLMLDNALIFDHAGKSLIIDETNYPMEASFKDSLAQNANNVSIINVILTSYPLNDNHYLIKLRDFVNGMLWFRNLDIREFIGLETGIYVLDEYIIAQNLIEDFASFLKDISGQQFSFATHAKTDKVLLCNYNGERIPFDIIASTGTHALMLLYFWIQRIKNASFVFIDEFDAFYHYQLAYNVCKQMFALPQQIFLSSHNTYLMNNDLLRPDCYFVLNNNKILSLSKSTDRELREAHNLEKIYKAGAFYGG